MTRLVSLAVLTATLALVGVSPTSAHTDLLGSTLQANTVLDDAPGLVELRFSDPIAEEFAIVTVRVADSTPTRLDVRTDKDLVLATVPRLREPAGPQRIWTIGYRVISTDGHPVEGSYSFTVAADPTATAGPARPVRSAESHKGSHDATQTDPVTAAHQKARRDDWVTAAVLGVLAGLLIAIYLAAYHRNQRRLQRSDQSQADGATGGLLRDAG